MKKMAWLGCLFAALFLVAGGRVALADNVSMHFDGVGGGSLGGEYVYPYNFTITTSHGTFQTALMCIDFHDNASIGGTWTADAELASSFTGDLGKNLLKAAAIIDHFGGTNAADANWAVWTLFEPGFVPISANLTVAFGVSLSVC